MAFKDNIEQLKADMYIGESSGSVNAGGFNRHPDILRGAMMQRVFRAARQEERDTVAALWKAAGKGEYSVWDDSYPGAAELDRDIAEGRLFVLDEAGTVIGTISVETESVPDELNDMPFRKDAFVKPGSFARVAVRPDFQGRGLAVELVRGAENQLRDAGFDGVRLFAAVRNIPAWRTYIRCGYRIAGSRFIYGAEHYAMEKCLIHKEKDT